MTFCTRGWITDHSASSLTSSSSLTLFIMACCRSSGLMFLQFWPPPPPPFCAKARPVPKQARAATPANAIHRFILLILVPFHCKLEFVGSEPHKRLFHSRHPLQMTCQGRFRLFRRIFMLSRKGS